MSRYQFHDPPAVQELASVQNQKEELKNIGNPDIGMQEQEEEDIQDDSSLTAPQFQPFKASHAA